MARMTQAAVSMQWHEARNFAPELRGIDPRTGARTLLTSMGNQMKPVNKRYAQLLQKDAARQLEMTRGPRPRDRRRRAGIKMRLSEAIMDPLNATSNDTGFGVGNTIFLDRVTPYWRQIEEGSTVHVGRQQRAWFVDGAGKLQPPAGFRRGQDQWSPRSATSRSAPLVRIKVPIEAHRFFARAMKQFDMDSYNRELLEVLHKGGVVRSLRAAASR